MLIGINQSGPRGWRNGYPLTPGNPSLFLRRKLYTGAIGRGFSLQNTFLTVAFNQHFMKFKYQHLDNWSDLTKQDLSCLLRIETVYVPSPPSLGEEERSRLLFIPRGWKTIADSWRLHKVEKSSRGQPLHAKDRSWPPQWVGTSRGWFSPLQPRTVRPFARSACAGLLGCCWELMSVGHVRAKPGHPRSHGQPGGGTVKPRSLATSLFPPPVIFFPALRMAIHHCKSLALKKKKKKAP